MQRHPMLSANIQAWNGPGANLKDERDQGIDDFNLKDTWRPSRDGGITSDTSTLVYKGTEPVASFRLQWGSNCFTTALRRTPGNTGQVSGTVNGAELHEG